MIRMSGFALAGFAVLVTAGLCGGSAEAAPLPAVTLDLAPSHAGSSIYGPADMLCDLDQCHMFSVPGFPRNGTIDFQMPQLAGQQRIDLRRCFNLCRVTVVGYIASDVVHRTPDQQNPSVLITPTELQLQSGER
jgi:hypothetical protein